MATKTKFLVKTVVAGVAGVAGVAVLALALTGCVGEDGKTVTPDAVTATAPGGFVQDLWLFEQITAINADGESHELTAPIAAYLGGVAPLRSVQLREGVTFYEYEMLAAMIVDTEVDAERARSDVQMTAGLIETKEGRVVAVLATPDPATRVPIYFKDVVKIDLSLLGSLVEPGDPMVFDYAFLQGIPTLNAAENGLDALELLAHRMQQESVQYYGQEVDGKSVAGFFTGELGMIVEGSKWAAFPPKSQAMLDGLDQGVESCVKDIFKNPNKCVKSFMEDFMEGTGESWELIDDQLKIVEEEVTHKKQEETEARIRQHDAKPAEPQKNDDCGLPDSGEGDEGEGDGGESDSGGGDASPDCTPPAPGAPGGPGVGTIGGDPHFRTFDGMPFSMQGIGEYLAAQHDTLTVQVRTHPVASQNQVTAVSAVAVGFGDHRLMIEAAELRVDGKIITDRVIDAGDVRIVNKNHIVTVRFDNGHLVRVVNRWGWALDLEVWDPQPGTWVGMLGDYDGDSANDFTRRDGHVYAKAPNFDEMYQAYSESWRVSQAESLFYYAAGEDTETFTDRTVPRVAITVDTLPPAHRVLAERMCRAAEISDPVVFDNCVLDYAVMSDLDNPRVPGQLGVLNSARGADRAIAFSEGLISTLGQRVPITDSSEGTVLIRSKLDDGDPAAWKMTGNELFAGIKESSQSLRCASGGAIAPVVGGQGSYSMESSVCTAAVHAGQITVAEGGNVIVLRSMAEDYTGFDDFVGGTGAGGIVSSSGRAGPSFGFDEFGH